MFLLSENYMSDVEANRVVLFYGSVGSYKTLQAVATAHALLKTKRFARCYANIPVTFASSPPRDLARFDFLDETYARDSIFIIDEAALFVTGKTDEIKQIFAFPRKNNQVFLLASVLPVKQIADFCHLFVHRNYNFSLIGLPLMSFLSAKQPKAQRKEKVSHFIFNYSYYFQKYSTKFKPESMYPIDQWRDRAILYDARSRKIPVEIVKFYCLNSYGLGERRKNLNKGEEHICNMLLPEFNLDYVDDKSLDLPKLQKKGNFLNFLGSEFRLGFLLQFVFIIYCAYIAIAFLANNTIEAQNVWIYSQENYVELLTGKPITLKRQNVTVKPKPTPKVIEWRKE